ncbi:MAG: polyprenyl synthetase family protein [Wolbachia sp.]|nr:polyprenyl synthetase family protein [Wolbachia sp.]MDD9336614.1 polyprenyl synthetase family protein [Wolbachia sp.]
MLGETIKKLFLEEIEKFLPKNNQSNLISAMRYMLLAPAKYVRPFLVIASSKVFNIEIKRILPIAVAIECIHSYSLIHDDLPCIDNSDTRRGQPSCHKKFDETTAVLAGDALLTLAFEILSSLDEDSSKRCEVIKVLSKAIGYQGMVKGQVLDINSENVDCDKIKEIHLMKTANLFAVSCKICAIINGATDEQQEALYSYGVNLGLIFQAKDDVKDYEQDKASNLVSVLSKSGVRDYIDDLFERALENLSALPDSTDYLYNLLDQIKND